MRDNVLVFPAENGCDIYRALRYNVHFDVFGASGKNDHAEFVYPQNKHKFDGGGDNCRVNFLRTKMCGLPVRRAA